MIVTASRLFVVGVAAVLAGCDPSTSPIAVAATLQDLDGQWHNENAATRSVTRVKFRVRTDAILFEAWGACTPVECYRGTEVADRQHWDEARELRVRWDHGFAIDTQVITLLEGGQLRVFTATHFTDNSGRQDRQMTEFFRKQ
jgi:hypothetical protein